MSSQSLTSDPLTVISLSFVIGTLGILAWLGVKPITGDINRTRPWLDQQVPNVTCCYDGTCLNVPLPHKRLPSKAGIHG